MKGMTTVWWFLHNFRKMVRWLIILVVGTVHVVCSFQFPFRETRKNSLSLQVVNKAMEEGKDKKTMLQKFWVTDELRKAMTSSELKTLTTDTTYEGRNFFNRTATSLVEKTIRLGALIISPRKDIPLEQQLDTALGRENKSNGWIKGSFTYISVLVLFWLMFQVIAKSN